MSERRPPGDDQTTGRSMSLWRWVAALIALALIVLAWWQVLAASRGLTVRTMTIEGVPMRYLVAEGAQDVPGVVVAHGFSGSQQLMLGYGYVLARDGYGVMLLDFAGHGANRGRPDTEGDQLQADLELAVAVLREQPEIDESHIALLGHSMGSGAVMRAAIESPETYGATVAVSPTGADVSPERPRNILYQAGTLEPRFLENAETLLAQSGGRSDNFADGLARDLVPVPNVEHISILFSATSHQSALDWLNRTFARPEAVAQRDSRILWYGAHLAGWLLLAVALKPLLPVRPGNLSVRRPPWHWLGLVAGVIAATLLLIIVGQFIELRAVGGLLVGGAIGIWFFVVGLVWLVSGFQIPRPTLADIAWGLVLFALLSLAFGAMAQLVWLPWLLNPERLLRWPVLALLSLPWLLATGIVVQRQPVLKAAGWWLVESLLIVAGLVGIAFAVPGLFFIVLLAPVIPVILAIIMVGGSVIGRPWSFAVGGAMFLGWLLAAVFPLA